MGRAITKPLVRTHRQTPVLGRIGSSISARILHRAWHAPLSAKPDIFGAFTGKVTLADYTIGTRSRRRYRGISAAQKKRIVPVVMAHGSMCGAETAVAGNRTVIPSSTRCPIKTTHRHSLLAEMLWDLVRDWEVASRGVRSTCRVALQSSRLCRGAGARWRGRR
jgi:hypothetical protein